MVSYISNIFNKDNEMIIDHIKDINLNNYFNIFHYEIDFGTKRMVILSINDISTKIGCLYSDYNEVSCYKDGKSLKVSQSLGNQLYLSLHKLHMREKKFHTSLLTLFNINEIELKERFDEFEVIKKNQIDYISLNNLFDFYNKDFDLDTINKIITFV